MPPDMQNGPFCPLSHASCAASRPCKEETCAWWHTQKKRCVIMSLNETLIQLKGSVQAAAGKTHGT